MTHIKKLGQYFTTNSTLQEKVIEFIRNKPTVILEPSLGQGDLIQAVDNVHPGIMYDAYEIDEKIDIHDNLKGNSRCNIFYQDFIKANCTKKYTTIIGNPPYVRHSKGNLYIDFIDKCVDLLDDKGELIFIIPSDFFKITSSKKVLSKMITQGNFTDVYYPHNEKLFENASIDVLIFRYTKSSRKSDTIKINGKNMKVINNDGMLIFVDNLECISSVKFEDDFNVYVGLVSGKENVFKHPVLGNLEIMTSQNTIEKYICLDNYPSKNKVANQHLLENKEVLINRKIRHFNEDNWFEWGALRNFYTITQFLGQDCIYVYNLTRKKEVAFIDKVKYFNGNLIILIPKDTKKYTYKQLQKVADYINSESFKSNFMYCGRFKIGHRQLSNMNLIKF